jgi:pectin methylesterase-like acyl-CoA thioesterase
MKETKLALASALACLLWFAPRIGHAAGLFPANGAAGVCPDTQLRLTFPAAAARGSSGKIQIFDAADRSLVESIAASDQQKSKTIGGVPGLHYLPVLLDGNHAIITLEKPLAYHHAYSIIVDPGFFQGDPGIVSKSAWHFTTKDAPPAVGDGPRKLTVAADGSGDFATIQGALDFLPEGNTVPTTVLVKNGTYHEIVFLTNKDHITILGEDRKKTILAYPNNDKFNKIAGNPFGGAAPDPASADIAKGDAVYHRGVFIGHRTNDLTLANLTIHNTTPHGGSQAEAIILNGTTDAHAILVNLDLYSFQDTLQINGQAFISHCYIEGDVDFMWGTGPCFFQVCTCTMTRSRAYYTQIRNQPTNHGYVYSRCTFNGGEGVADGFLSRIATAKYPASEVVLIDCTLTNAVGPIAWQVSGDASRIHFWEYNSHTPDGKPIDTSKRLPASRQLTQPADAETIAHYSTPAWVLGDNWTPKLPDEVAEQSPRPANGARP